MGKSLGFRLMDAIRAVGEYEVSIIEIDCALFNKKINEAIENGSKSIEEYLKAQSIVYDINLENYFERLKMVKSEYLNQANKLREEYELQFVNSQLELRDALAKQKIALVNAKKALDTKKETNDTSGVYDQNKNQYLNEYYGYDDIVKKCEDKIKSCMSECTEEIEKIATNNVPTSIAIKNENFISKFINKIKNMFSGKTKFEGELEKVEGNINGLSIVTTSKIQEIRKDTTDFVGEIYTETANLSS